MSAGVGAGRIVAVTGATGFLGRRLVPALAAQGWRVRVLVRGKTPVWPGVMPEIVRGDLTAPQSLVALAAGSHAVIHAAGLVKARNRAEFFAVNVAGLRLTAECLGAGRMILVSSLAAREPGLSDYSASKRAGESAARAVLGEALMVMRPPAIYGPGDRETLALFKLAGASPVLPVPDDPAARIALVHVDDVVAALMARLNAAWLAGVYALGGARPEGYGWNEIFATAAAAMGRTPRLAPLPPRLIEAAAAVSQAAAQLRGSAVIFNRGKARELLHPDWSVSAAEAPPGPSAPCIDLPTGFGQTVAWYRAEHWL